MRLGEDAVLPDIKSISTGSLSLNIALGIGGVPCGRIVEIYGPESSGKTTLALHVAAEAQKKGGDTVGAAGPPLAVQAVAERNLLRLAETSDPKLLAGAGCGSSSHGKLLGSHRNTIAI